MGRLQWLLLLGLLSGCAAHHAPTLTAPIGPGSSDWGAVRALPKGAFIFVTLEGSGTRQGGLGDVTDAGLTIRDVYGMNTIARNEIVQVANRVQTGMKRAPWYVGVPVISLILGGLTTVIVGAVQKDGDVRRAGWLTFGTGMMAGAATGPLDHPRPTFEDRLVYVRP
jgi:hypothetical protein